MFLEENVERDAVHKALLSLLRQDVKGNFLYNQISGRYLYVDFKVFIWVLSR